MNLKPIADYLEEQGVATAGVDLFINQMQATDTGVMLKESYRGTAIDYELPGYYKGEFGVVVRARDVATGQALMAKVMGCLSIQRETQLGTMFVKYLRARSLPVSYPIPASGLQESLVTVDCCFVLTYDK